MRVFRIGRERFVELDGLPPAGVSGSSDGPASDAPSNASPDEGFWWIACKRSEFEAQLAEIQPLLQRKCGSTLVDLHVSDLLNPHLPSHFDDTSGYDLLVFRRLAAGTANAAEAAASAEAGAAPPPDARAQARTMRRTLASIDTSPVGFAVFDSVLVTVHPDDCLVRDFFAQRLATLAPGRDLRGANRLPASPAELMLRMVNHMVDGYLSLRRLLTHHLGGLQQRLLDPKGRFADWRLLLEARNTLHLLEDLCEDQRSAVQEWIDVLDEWPAAAAPEPQREHELLRVRSRDLLEHIERVLAHVRRLEHSAETAVQMHFSALSNRTNQIMRTLTVLTAVFLPLNFVTGFFGMNFDSLPLIHSATGIWIAIGLMATLFIGLMLFFWRKRYLSSSARDA